MKNSRRKRSIRIVVIGLDSADFYLVQKWINEGHMPAMASLIARGSWGKLSSSADVSIGRPRLKSGTYRVIYELYYATQLKREPFWLRLSQAGKRVAILDVPKTILSRD